MLYIVFIIYCLSIPNFHYNYFYKYGYFIFNYFRLETILPAHWFKAIHSLGDRIFQSNREDSSLHPYDAFHKKSDGYYYKKSLEMMPQRELIKRIMQLEEKSN